MGETSAAPLISWSRDFHAVPEQAREARRFLGTILDGRANADDALLCLSELVTNATMHSNSRHAGGQITVRVQLHGSRLRVEVTDQGGPWIAHPSDPAGLHGRGLVILSRLAHTWGRIGNPSAGWTAWFEMASALTTSVPQANEGTDQRWISVLNGHTLRRLRRQHGLSQEQLATKAGLSLATVARLERKPLEHLPVPHPRPARRGHRRTARHSERRNRRGDGCLRPGRDGLRTRTAGSVMTAAGTSPGSPSKRRLMTWPTTRPRWTPSNSYA